MHRVFLLIILLSVNRIVIFGSRISFFVNRKSYFVNRIVCGIHGVNISARIYFAFISANRIVIFANRIVCGIHGARF